VGGDVTLGARSLPRCGLHPGQHGFNFRGVTLDVGTQGVGYLFEGFGEVTVVADGIDDGARDGELAGLEPCDLELPEQMLLQGLAGGVGIFLLALVVVLSDRRDARTFVFDEIDRLGYTGFVGCEYNPRGKTTDGLGWFKTYAGKKP